jgi:hypothetical protein
VNSATAKHGYNSADYRRDVAQLYPKCWPYTTPLIDRTITEKAAAVVSTNTITKTCVHLHGSSIL